MRRKRRCYLAEFDNMNKSLYRDFLQDRGKTTTTTGQGLHVSANAHVTLGDLPLYCVIIPFPSFLHRRDVIELCLDILYFL